MITRTPGDEGGIIPISEDNASETISESNGLKIYAFALDQAKIFRPFGNGWRPSKAADFYEDGPQEACKEVEIRHRQPKTREGIADDLRRLEDDDGCDRLRHPDINSAVYVRPPADRCQRSASN